MITVSCDTLGLFSKRAQSCVRSRALTFSFGCFRWRSAGFHTKTSIHQHTSKEAKATLSLLFVCLSIAPFFGCCSRQQQYLYSLLLQQQHAPWKESNASVACARLKVESRGSGSGKQPHTTKKSQSIDASQLLRLLLDTLSLSLSLH